MNQKDGLIRGLGTQGGGCWNSSCGRRLCLATSLGGRLGCTSSPTFPFGSQEGETLGARPAAMGPTSQPHWTPESALGPGTVRPHQARLW